MKLDVAVNSVGNMQLEKVRHMPCCAYSQEVGDSFSTWEEKCAHTKLSGKDIMPISTT